MQYNLVYTEGAREDLRRLPVNIHKRILLKLDFFIHQGDPFLYAKKLNDCRYGMYRFRIGDYRVIFDMDRNGVLCVLVVLRVRHRKAVYE